MSFRSIAEELLDKFYPTLKLSEDAVIIINQLMSLISPQIEPINSTNQLNTIISEIFPGTLATHATTELQNALNQTGTIANLIESGKRAIYRYILAEIIDLSGELTLKNNEDTIDAYIIISAIRDDELYYVFQPVIPQFPYGNSVDVASIIRAKTQGYTVTPGFILAVQDYIHEVLGNVKNYTTEQLAQLSQRFGTENPQYRNTDQGLRGLTESIIDYIIKTTISGRQDRGEIGFMDVLAALQSF